MLTGLPTDRSGCTLYSGYWCHMHIQALTETDRETRRGGWWKARESMDNKSDEENEWRRKSTWIFPFCQCVQHILHLCCCVCVLAAEQLISPLLGLHHSTARCLATLTQGKFGWLKINLVLAERDVKLKKQRENKADSSVMKQKRRGEEQNTSL